jgi:hypothetical protein
MATPKGIIRLLCFYDGTAVELVVYRERYNEMKAMIKKNARDQVKEFLEMEEFKGDKEKVADMLQGQMDILHKKILNAGTTSDDEVLEKAWGNDWKKLKAVWATNISALLHLKRIQNDNNHGWVLMDHNSIQSSQMSVIYGWKDDEAKIAKKAMKIAKEMK